MSGEPVPSLVCCGLIGATVQDDGMLERAFAEACATQGIVPGTAAYAHCMVAIHQARGQPPLAVFRGLFPGSDGRAEAATLSFERAYRTLVERTGLAAVPGAVEAVASLRDAGLRVCMITGLSRRLLGVVLDSLDWSRQVDLALCADDVPRGCPWPDLILTAMLRLGVQDVRETVFAGSTASGILSGKRSGARTVLGVLTGGHTADRLRAAGATGLIGGLCELPGLLLEGGPDGGPGSGTGTESGAGAAAESGGAGGAESGVAGRAGRSSRVEQSGTEAGPARAGPAGGEAPEVASRRGVPLDGDAVRGREAELKSEPGKAPGTGGYVRGKMPGRGVMPGRGLALGFSAEVRGVAGSGVGRGQGASVPRVVAPAWRAVAPAPRVSLERRSAGL